MDGSGTGRLNCKRRARVVWLKLSKSSLDVTRAAVTRIKRFLDYFACPGSDLQEKLKKRLQNVEEELQASQENTNMLKEQVRARRSATFLLPRSYPCLPNGHAGRPPSALLTLRGRPKQSARPACDRDKRYLVRGTGVTAPSQQKQVAKGRFPASNGARLFLSKPLARQIRKTYEECDADIEKKARQVREEMEEAAEKSEKKLKDRSASTNPRSSLPTTTSLTPPRKHPPQGRRARG